MIYAATVEMIAGDFVFGDVEGHGGHHHHHHDGDAQENPGIGGSSMMKRRSFVTGVRSRDERRVGRAGREW